jgi:hypothetical protein
MSGLFDIFKMDDIRTTVWVDSASTLDDAKASVKKMMLEAPGEYVIFNQTTRDRLLINRGDLVS